MTFRRVLALALVTLLAACDASTATTTSQMDATSSTTSQPQESALLTYGYAA